MIKWKKLINESVDEKAFKKLLKQNGITKLPSGTKFSDGKAKWNKEGGYAGEKTLSAMRAQLRNAGWQKKNGSSGASPDGSSTGMENEYVSPDGQIVASYCSYYGATVHDNFYSFTFKLVGGQVNEAKITGAGRIDFDDDIVAVYTPDGKLEYKGLFDECPYKDDDMKYDKSTMTYRVEGPRGDYRIIAKIA